MVTKYQEIEILKFRKNLENYNMALCTHSLAFWRKWSNSPSICVNSRTMNYLTLLSTNVVW